MQMSFLAFTAAVLCVGSVVFADAEAIDGPDRELARLEEVYHVQIHGRPDLATSFPPTWLEPSLRMVAAPIENQDAVALMPALEQFLAAHPPSVIKENLEHIYLLGKLSFRERDYGGTHSGKSMYIVWDQNHKNSVEFILERFHSEFSSILRDHHAFPNRRWNAINPTGFSYSGTGFEMLGRGSIYDSTEPDQDNGFLVKYSMSSQENDFNIMSAWLFTRPNDLDVLGRQHERIQRKKMLAEEFYRSLSDQYAFHQAGPPPTL